MELIINDTRAAPRRNLLRACFHGVRVALHLMVGILLAIVYPAFSQAVRARILRGWSRDLLGILQVRVEPHGHCLPADLQGRMLVANHASWLDIFALNAIAPACFVAKSEVRGWPLLGWLSHRAGTLYIKRGVRRDTARVNREIAEVLRQEKCVAVFPEGTSSDAGLPGHFHSALLQGAIDAGSSISPVAIRYHDEAGNACSDAAFIGDMSFVESLWNILCSPSLHVSLFYLPPLACAEENRRVLAVQAHGSIHMALARFSLHHAVNVADAATSVDWSAPLVALPDECFINS